MALRIGRTLPPAAAPIRLGNIVSGMIGVLRGGKTVRDFEEELKEYYRVGHCFAVSSGKAALTVILLALKEMFPDRDEVLIPAFTCYSLPSAIVRAGLKIRLCDLAPGTFDFDYEQLSTIVATDKDRLLCVVPVHLFGYPADLDRIRDIIADDSVVIVEDAAQAMGGEHNGKKMGSVGDVGFFSLGRGKALSTIEGGVIITRREDIARHMSMIINRMQNYSPREVVALFFYAVALFVLSNPSLFWLPKALPFLRLGETIYDPDFRMTRMSPFQAGVARGWERKLREFRMSRAENVQEMLAGLESIGRGLSWGDGHLIRLPLKTDSEGEREAILRESERMGLGIARTYPDSVDHIPEIADDFPSHHFPIAKEYAERLLTLPVHPHVTRRDRDTITDMLIKVKRT